MNRRHRPLKNDSIDFELKAYFLGFYIHNRATSPTLNPTFLVVLEAEPFGNQNLDLNLLFVLFHRLLKPTQAKLFAQIYFQDCRHSLRFCLFQLGLLRIFDPLLFVFFAADTHSLHPLKAWGCCILLLIH